MKERQIPPDKLFKWVGNIFWPEEKLKKTKPSRGCSPGQEFPRREGERMDKVASANINTFGPSPKADVPPEEESVFVLTSSQLQELISRAIQPLQEEMAALHSRLAELESLQESEISRVCCDIAYDRQRLARLENPIKRPGKTETARAEKIEKYLASRPDHRATFETLKGHLGIDNVLLNQAIKTLMDCSSGQYGITRTPGDKRKRTLFMLPK